MRCCHLDDVADTYVINLAVREDGTVFLATNTSVLQYKDDGFKCLLSFNERDWIWSLKIGEDGRLWASTRGGKLLVFDEGQAFNVGAVGGAIGRGLCIDYRGRIWLGTFGIGVYRYDETQIRVFNQEHGLPSDFVHCVVEDNQGGLFVGTNRGLTRYDGQTFLLPAALKAIAAREITSFWLGEGEVLWIGSRRGQLLSYDASQNDTDSVISEGNGYSLAHLVEDREGKVWFAYRFLKTLSVYDGKKVRVCKPGGSDVFPFLVGAIAVSQSGRLLVGSCTPATWDGLFALNGDKLELVKNLQGAKVQALCQDGNGRVWVGTNEGVFILDEDRVEQIKGGDGLPCELVTSLLDGKDGTIWIGTEGGGVCRYDGQVLQVVQYASGTAFDVVNGLCQDRLGRVWIATPAGLVQYTPGDKKPSVQIEAVEAAGISYGPGAAVSLGEPDSCLIRLKGLDFSGQGNQLVFRYRLEPKDAEWCQSRTAQIEYRGLEPGTYTFKVQAVDRDLNYSPIRQIGLTVAAVPNAESAVTEALSAVNQPLTPLLGRSPTIENLRRQIKEVADLDISVLVLGQTGTGKGVVAQLLHDWSIRAEKPFITVNCGAIANSLVDSELFGHEKGAFTGAHKQRKGKFELAEGGTIFLDEIGDLPLEAQTRLLHVLQDKSIDRVGGTAKIDIEVRVIAATNRDLPEAVQSGAFRRDLFYRLNTFPIQLPALKDRAVDIPLLAAFFAESFAKHLHKPTPKISVGAMEVLTMSLLC